MKSISHNFCHSQSDGPFNNVLKIKPPLAFSRENVDTFITTLDSIIEDIEDMQAF